MTTFTISLTEAEVNGVLQALGQMPFSQVAELIANIRTQALAQIPPVGSQDDPAA